MASSKARSTGEKMTYGARLRGGGGGEGGRGGGEGGRGGGEVATHVAPATVAQGVMRSITWQACSSPSFAPPSFAPRPLPLPLSQPRHTWAVPGHPGFLPPSPPDISRTRRSS
jgi:hypothetical protein